MGGGAMVRIHPQLPASLHSFRPGSVAFGLRGLERLGAKLYSSLFVHLSRDPWPVARNPKFPAGHGSTAP